MNRDEQDHLLNRLSGILIRCFFIVSIKAKKYLHIAITNHRSRQDDFDVLVRKVIGIGNELA